MRIRSIKPEFWRSLDISELAIEDRLLFIGIWSYVDDNGVGVDRDAVIAADLFADDLSRDSRETLARVSGGLLNLSEAGLIVRFSVDGRDFLEVVNWSKHQRIDKPAKPRHPQCDAEGATIRDGLPTPSRESRDSLAPGTGEQGNRGTEEQGISNSAVAELFEDAWKHWPKKVEKKNALTKFRAACKKRDPHELAADIARFGDAYAQTTDRQFTPGLAVWLNGERWTDELPAAHARQSNTRDNLALIARMEQEERYGAFGSGEGDYLRELA